MLQTAPRSAPISPAVMAFAVRNLRGGMKKSNINPRDIIKGKQRIRRKPLKFASKNKGGAPRGNHNALASGLYTKEVRALRTVVRGMVAELKLATALVKAEAARMDADTSMRLCDAGLFRRSLWPSEL